MKREFLSIIVPAYNEEPTIEIFLNEAEKYTSRMPVDVEYLFVNDGSSDNTLAVLKKLSEENKKVRYLSFSRNFGKEAAIYAGMKYSKGDYVVIMDADLQDPPSLLPEMYRLITEEGFDCVGSRRVDRKGEPPQPYVQNRRCGWRERFSDDAEKSSRRDSQHAGEKSFLKGYFWLGWF